MTTEENRSDGWQLERSGPEAYERYLVPGMFAPWADRLLERVSLGPDERVLDVACGTGIVARRAARRVGEDGTVVGLDLNEGMLDIARSAASQHSPSIEWRQGDATDLPFPAETFDVVVCQQALQFVPDPASALAEMHRVLVPDGRLAVSVWRPIEFNPAYVVMADALGRHAGEDAATMMRSPFPDWDRPALHALLREADLREAVVTIEVGSMRYPSTEAFLRREAASSPLSEPLGALDPAVRDALLEDLEAELSAHVDDRGVVFPMETYVADARR